MTARGLIVAAPQSGAGKTTITLALVAALRRRGLKVGAAKAGPDYIDPAFHAAASGSAAVNLDSWAMPDALIEMLAARATDSADIFVIEGVMGLFDGAAAKAGRRGATADLATHFELPVVLVLDDVHLLHNRECRSALSVLAEHVPKGSRLVLAGRNEPPLRIARLRAEGRITEIGPADLSLTQEEAAALLRAAGLALDDGEVAELYRRTEGWAAGLYLAALYLREGGPVGTAAVSFRGDDRLVSEYMKSEFLARISRRQRAFLTRTAVLERMSGPLCDAVLELPGSATTLADLERSNLLLVPLDRRGEWYRYHHLFRDMLLAQLHRRERGLMPVLRRRAASWCLGHDRPEDALEYSIAAGDVDTAAGLVELD